MTATSKRDRDFAAASLASLESLLGTVPASDPLAQLSLEGRREELNAQIADMEPLHEATAAASLFFGGAPVVGQRGIEAEFAGKAVGYFQDLVTKLFAEQQDIAMATRGPVPGKSASKLHITNVVRGSFGFLLEEAEAQGSLIDTRLKAAVERATGLISAFGDANNEAFEEALTSVDERTLVSARSFFDLLKQDDATFRLVTGEFEATFGRDLIARAAERADASSLHETRDSLYGMLTGILPDHHSFEFRLTSDQTTISGKVVPTISSAELETMNRNLLFKEIRATFRVKRLLRKGALVRENYTLENVGPPELSMMNPVVTSR